MKKLLVLYPVLLFSFSSLSQSVIQSLTITPPSPIALIDTIYIYADLQFPSSGCELDTMSYDIVGNNILAGTHHCLGMLTTICNTADTFKINPLPAGTYTFNLTLTTGMAPAPCNPGIVVDDNDSISFEVIEIIGIEENKIKEARLYPNPALDKLYLDNLPYKTLSASIYSVEGKLLKTVSFPNGEIDISTLTGGIYWLILIDQSKAHRYRFNKTDK